VFHAIHGEQHQKREVALSEQEVAVLMIELLYQVHKPRSMGLLGVTRADTAVGVSSETFLLVLQARHAVHFANQPSVQGGSRAAQFKAEYTYSCRTMQQEERLVRTGEPATAFVGRSHSLMPTRAALQNEHDCRTKAG
jgi:hypothetical protein